MSFKSASAARFLGFDGYAGWGFGRGCL